MKYNCFAISPNKPFIRYAMSFKAANLFTAGVSIVLVLILGFVINDMAAHNGKKQKRSSNWKTFLFCGR